MHPQLPALHALQAQIVAHDARFKVLACGRRFGKTTLASAEKTRVLDRGGHVA